MICKLKNFFLSVEGLLMHKHALVAFDYIILNMDIPFEFCTYKLMKGSLKGPQKVMFRWFEVPGVRSTYLKWDWRLYESALDEAPS